MLSFVTMPGGLSGDGDGGGDGGDGKGGDIGYGDGGGDELRQRREVAVVE